MTKAEEKKILAKIAELIASAGEDSYIGAAFAGCVEKAELNIQNDWMMSWKETAESVQKELDSWRNAYREQKKHIEQQAAKIEQLEQKLEQANAKQLPADLYGALRGMLSGSFDREERSIAAEAENLAAFADCPNDIAVGAALKRLALAKSRRNQSAELLTRLEECWKEI